MFGMGTGITLAPWTPIGVSLRGERHLSASICTMELDCQRKISNIETALSLWAQNTAPFGRHQKLAILEEVDPGWLTHYTHVLGVDRTGWYRPATRQRRVDAVAIAHLQDTHEQHPFYGVRGLALGKMA